MSGLLEEGVEESVGRRRSADEDDDDVEIEALDSLDDEDEDMMDDEDEEAVEGGGGGEAGDVPLGEDENVVAQLMDIREPLFNLRRRLEEKLGGVDLSCHSFWLQDAQMLPDDTTLVEQCVQGEGMVQVNVEIM